MGPEEFKPCPFCGNSQADVTLWPNHCYYVLCACGARGPGVHIENSPSTSMGKRERKIAIANWNERSPV